MCRVVTHALGPGVGAAALAREAVRTRLQLWEMPELLIDATLLVSEVVTNAVLHGRGEVSLTLAVADGELEIGVTDEDPTRLPVRSGPGTPEGLAAPAVPAELGAEPGPPWLTDPSAPMWAEGGRGLRLLDSLADDWGVARLAGGKQVWFRLSVPDRWPYRTQCPCGGDDLEAVRLESGARVLAVAGPWDAAAG